jgi:lipoprotein-anchoring transpeptidase ErfK/SrfK
MEKLQATHKTKYLGHPASHGCVRLHPSNAAALYSLVKTYGAANTVIRISH